MSSPREFEEAVARALQAEGYTIRLTGGANDWGVDLFAARGDERLAVQAKMYAGARPVNRRQIFELHGVAAYFDCTGAVLATDGELIPDAAAAASKLRVRVLRLGPSDQRGARPNSSSALDFETIWARSVMPLAGRTLTRRSGASNTVVRADWGGVTRVTSTGHTQHIDIEIFRWAIERVLTTGSVTRSEINDQYEHRASSGITLILGQVPEFVVGGRPIAVCLRKERARPAK